MAKKHTYKHTLPDGYTAKRTTARTYTHIIIVEHQDGDWFTQKWGTPWGVFGWSGRRDLAEKQAQTARGWGVYKSVRVEEVYQP